MAHIDSTGHLHLDSAVPLVLCPTTGHIEDVITHTGDQTPSEPICEGCYEVFNLDVKE